MKVVTTIVVKRGTKQLAEVVGVPINGAHLSVEDVAEKILEAEKLLEKITGHRWHISTENI